MLAGTYEAATVLQMLQACARANTITRAHARSHSISSCQFFVLTVLFCKDVILLSISRFTSGAAACHYYRIHPRPTRKNHTPCSCITVAKLAQQFSSFVLLQRDLSSENAQEGAGCHRTIEPRVWNQPLVQRQLVTFAAGSNTSGAFTTPARFGLRTICSRYFTLDLLPLRQWHPRTRSCCASATTSKTPAFSFMAAQCSGQVAAS
jgi:hypothetical protein